MAGGIPRAPRWRPIRTQGDDLREAFVEGMDLMEWILDRDSNTAKDEPETVDLALGLLIEAFDSCAQLTDDKERGKALGRYRSTLKGFRRELAEFRMLERRARMHDKRRRQREGQPEPRRWWLEDQPETEEP